MYDHAFYDSKHPRNNTDKQKTIDINLTEQTTITGALMVRYKNGFMRGCLLIIRKKTYKSQHMPNIKRINSPELYGDEYSWFVVP